MGCGGAPLGCVWCHLVGTICLGRVHTRTTAFEVGYADPPRMAKDKGIKEMELTEAQYERIAPLLPKQRGSVRLANVWVTGPGLR